MTNEAINRNPDNSFRDAEFERIVISVAADDAALARDLERWAEGRLARLPQQEGVDRAALERAWTNFLDANPDDLTSPDDLPDHAFVTCDQFICMVEAALSLPPAALAGEWVMVPREPTEAMVVAGCRHENFGDMAGRYKAMLAAAPLAAPSDGGPA